MTIDDKYCHFCAGSMIVKEQNDKTLILECENKAKKCPGKMTLKMSEIEEEQPLFKPQFSLKNQFKHIF